MRHERGAFREVGRVGAHVGVAVGLEKPAEREGAGRVPRAAIAVQENRGAVDDAGEGAEGLGGDELVDERVPVDEVGGLGGEGGGAEEAAGANREGDEQARPGGPGGGGGRGGGGEDEFQGTGE